MYTRETEIRHINAADVYKLAQILDLNDSWKKLMQIIPKEINSETANNVTDYKYTYDDVRLIDKLSKNESRTATEILLDEWGTSGRKRPTMGVLLDLLVKAELFRAADLVAINYLNEPPPARPLKGPAAKIDISLPIDTEEMADIESLLNGGDSRFPATETLNDNANPSRLADNNIDFYEKYTPNNKKIPIPPESITSNGITNLSTDINAVSPYAPPEQDQQNIPSADNGVSTPELSSQQEQLVHSDLMKFSSSKNTDSQVIPMLSDLLPSTVVTDSNNSQVTNSAVQSMDIPMVSALNLQLSLGEILPNLSALHVADEERNVDKLKLPEELPSMLSSPSASSISSTTDDDDDFSAPNLSLLDQRSSNNDSSLTNVTATSEENSFEISMNENSTSFDNIPCLSALK